jgi:hypothetical protein
MIGRKEAQKPDRECCSQGAYRRAVDVIGMNQNFLRLFASKPFGCIF